MADGGPTRSVEAEPRGRSAEFPERELRLAAPSAAGAGSEHWPSAAVPALLAAHAAVEGGDGSLSGAALAVAEGLARAVPEWLPVVEVVRSPLELDVQAAPTVPAGFLAAAYPSVIGAESSLPAAMALHRGTVLVEPSIAASSTWAAQRDLPLGFGLRACWAAPSSTRAGGAAVSVYAGVELPPDPALVAVLVAFADLWAAAVGRVHRARLALLAGGRWRARLAGDLHDQPVQDVIAADLRLQRLAMRGPEDLRPMIGEVRAHTADAQESLRNLGARLDASAPDGAGAPATALRRICTAALTSRGVAWELDDGFEREVGPLTLAVVAAVVADALEHLATRPAGIDATVALALAGDSRRLETTIEVPAGSTTAGSSTAGAPDQLADLQAVVAGCGGTLGLGRRAGGGSRAGDGAHGAGASGVSSIGGGAGQVEVLHLDLPVLG